MVQPATPTTMPQMLLTEPAMGGTGEAELAREPNSPTDSPVRLVFFHNRRLRLISVATVAPLPFEGMRSVTCILRQESSYVLSDDLL
jgi:hypothetical protein